MPVLKIGLNKLISYIDIKGIIYRFNCFCDRRYIGQTSRHLKTRVKEHVPRCVKSFIECKTKIKNTEILNKLINHRFMNTYSVKQDRGKNYEDIRFLKLYISVQIFRFWEEKQVLYI